MLLNAPPYPITDDHIHIDPVNGRGIQAAKDFRRAGGTHLFLVSKPSGSFGIVPRSGDDFRVVFEETLSVAETIREVGLTVFPVLGVHPAEVTRLSAEMDLESVKNIMKGGLDLAAEYVREGKAIAIKSGRPHYEAPHDIQAVSNEVLFHAFTLAAGVDCAVQVHAESGPCADMIEMASRAGLTPGRVVKHYATPDTPLVPSFLASHPDIPLLCRGKRAFTMESDFMDENSRPGAVIGPKSVPKYTNRLYSSGEITEEDIYRIHVDTPSKVYGVEISL